MCDKVPQYREARFMKKKYSKYIYDDDDDDGKNGNSKQQQQ